MIHGTIDFDDKHFLPEIVTARWLVAARVVVGLLLEQWLRASRKAAACE